MDKTTINNGTVPTMLRTINRMFGDWHNHGIGCQSFHKSICTIDIGSTLSCLVHFRSNSTQNSSRRKSVTIVIFYCILVIYKAMSIVVKNPSKFTFLVASHNSFDLVDNILPLS